MVSFFGLKFGGNKKKSQDKAGSKAGPGSCNASEQKERPQKALNGSFQQNDHLVRPGTSHSIRKGASSWRATFKGFGANSSMTDLTAPTCKQNASRLPYQSSEATLKNPWINNSTTDLLLPSPLRSGPRAESLERPSTANARTKEWSNPPSVHFAKNPQKALPALSPVGPKANSPLGLEITTNDDNHNDGEAVLKTSSCQLHKQQKPASSNTIHMNGYPSPPQSVDNSEQTPSPLPSETSHGPTGTNVVPLPSPAASASRSSEERWETPVIRNVLTKRDTTTFNSPRSRSFTMDLEQQECERLRRQRRIEGFSGSFADFDFGENVTKQLSIEQFPEPPASCIKINSRQGSGAAPASQGSQKSQSKIASVRQAETTSNIEAQKTPLARPTTSYSRFGGQLVATAGAHPGNDSFKAFEPPPRLGFRARLGSDASSRPKTSPPAPLQMNPAARVRHEEANSEIPSVAPADSENRLAARDGGKHGFSIDSPRNSSQRTVLERNFPVTNGLPRGRQPPQRPPRSDETLPPERSDSFFPPDWGVLVVDDAQPRHSAIPPPLTTANQRRPSTPSVTPLLLPCPSFTSLELSISDSGESLAQAFEEALGKTSWPPSFVDDLISNDATASSAGLGAGAGVEAKRMSSQPLPLSLPSSPKSAEPLSPVSVQTRFNVGFI